jgi:hypothetical protein
MKKGVRRDFGYVRQLKSGKFQASFKMGKKTIYAPSSFLTRTEAKNWLSEQKYLVTVGQFKFPEKPKSNELSFYEFAVTYLNLKTNSKAMPLSPSYVAKCKQHLAGNLKVFASRSLNSITKTDVENWWMAGVKANKITSTSNAYRFLKAVFNKAIADGVIEAVNPCSIKGAGSASTGVITYTPTRDDILKLVGVSPVSFGTYVALSFSALLRFEEASCLTVADLKKHSNSSGTYYSVSINKSVARVDGKFVLGPTKSEMGNRENLIPPVFNDLIEAHLRTLGATNPSALLFPSAKARTYLHNSVIQKQLHRYRKMAGLDHAGFTLHGLRRGGATAFAELGSTFAEVKELLGDASTEAAQRYVRTTQRVNDMASRLFDNGVSPTA